MHKQWAQSKLGQWWAASCQNDWLQCSFGAYHLAHQCPKSYINWNSPFRRLVGLRQYYDHLISAMGIPVLETGYLNWICNLVLVGIDRITESTSLMHCMLKAHWSIVYMWEHDTSECHNKSIHLNLLIPWPQGISMQGSHVMSLNIFVAHLWEWGMILLAWWKTAVSPLLMHWRYCSLALNRDFVWWETCLSVTSSVTVMSVFC